ncbi:hypothetical protein [Candidatus Venteria ishoeyi]|uniref:Peptidase S8/S53 domain-containing protein n=1 Tax=Candidatus Venteria ishoeyi TaxID=1899563 RepID=A0A1H6FHR1_9GAMM|nr:hypothetical protein [Candidatus Venteria ishoeyi]SEH08544.1 Uncharacterised protein [Candidatus Venteria ishoeyi]
MTFPSININVHFGKFFNSLILVLYCCLMLQTTVHAVSSNGGNSVEQIGVAAKLSQKEKKALQRLEKTGLKFKRQQINEAVKKRLLGKIEKIHTRSKAKKPQKFLEAYKKTKRELQTRWREKPSHQRKNLSRSERQVLKAAQQAKRQNLKQINQALKQNLDEIVATELSAEEQALVELEPNYLFELQNTPSFDDLRYAEQWGLQSIAVEAAFPLSTDSEISPVIVALIDTGVGIGHEDLQGHIWNSTSCVDDLGEAIVGGCPVGGYDLVGDSVSSGFNEAQHGYPLSFVFIM